MLRRKVTVTEALTDVKGHVSFGPPKSKAARRTISMPQTLVDELAAHLAAYPVGEDGPVFTGARGGPIRLTNGVGASGTAQSTRPSVGRCAYTTSGTPTPPC